MSDKERKIEVELYRLIKNFLVKNEYKIEGVRFDDIESQFTVNAGIADLMLPVHPKTPRLIIECKRKRTTAKGVASTRNFDPLSHLVIDQALNYATHCGATMFATTNGEIFAMFEVPPRGEPFRIDRHRILLKEIQLNEQSVSEILVTVGRWLAGVAIIKTPVDWAFILRLRSFVEYLSLQILPCVKEELEHNADFRQKVDEFSSEIAKLTPERFARESAYVLMNKIVFYKILERQYDDLPRLRPITGLDANGFVKSMTEIFNRVVPITRDFEPIFSTGLFDWILIPNEPTVLDELNSFIEEMDRYRLEEIEADIVGFIYERIIPDKERHDLGQFYTPPQIAELITKWAIRSPKDTILDPATGSGGFLIKAYNAFRNLDPELSHKEILPKLFCLDINPFPAQLAAMNLAMRDVKHPVSEMNIVVDDFFNLNPHQTALAPYSIRTASGVERRKIHLDDVSVVVANPPYTRWLEVPPSTRKAVSASIGNLMKKYGLQPRIRAGFEIGIYIYFILHATSFLQNAGRLGMIISNSWLQSDYGASFGNFLLDNFKVKAVLDFSARLFGLPLVATCVILLEKENDGIKRDQNQVLFLRVEKETSVEELLTILNNPDSKSAHPKVLVAQNDLPRDRNWIGVMFGATSIERRLEAKTVTVGTFFETSRGTITYSALKSRGLGANEFFYLDKETIQQWSLERSTVPLLTGPKYCKQFSFNEKDWNSNKDKGSPCFLFLCSKPRPKLPRSVAEYIKWGETKCRSRYGEICSRSQACKERESDRANYRGWYDVGGVRESAIFTAYYAQYVHRFVLSEFQVALDADFIALTPKRKLTPIQLKALLAYLNSSFVRFSIELSGRATGGGMISLEVEKAEHVRMLDLDKLNTRQTRVLASLFERLDKGARKIGGADTQKKLEALDAIVFEIDKAVCEILGINEKDLRRIRDIVNLMRIRRVSRAKEASPNSVGGEAPSRIRPPTKKGSEDHLTVPLERWTQKP